MDIHEVKLLKNNKVKIKFSFISRTDGDKNFASRGSITCDEPVHQDFYDLLAELNGHAVKFLEFDEKEKARLTVTGAKFTETADGITGAQIYATRKLSHSDILQEVITPHKTEMPYNEDSEEQENEVLGSLCVGILGDLQIEAEKYLQQFRDQMNIFDAGPEE